MIARDTLRFMLHVRNVRTVNVSLHSSASRAATQALRPGTVAGRPHRYAAGGR